MSNLSVGMRQIIRHMGRDKRISLGSFLVLAIILLLIDIFWVASINIDHQYELLLQTVRMEIFISDSLPDDNITLLQESLGKIEMVDSVTFISKDDAARILEGELGAGILDNLDSNPLPRSFILRFRGRLDMKMLDGLKDRLMKLTGVEAVEYGRTWIEKVERMGRFLRYGGYFIGALILFVVLLTMANTNRLTARSKARDFYQLKLLGAGPRYLVTPYLAEGFISALVAALLGWSLILYVSEKISFTYFELMMPPVQEIMIYAVLAGFTGMLGSYLGIRRYLL